MADIGIATKQESSQFPIIFEKLNIAIVTNTRTIISKNDYNVMQKIFISFGLLLKDRALIIIILYNNYGTI